MANMETLFIELFNQLFTAPNGPSQDFDLSCAAWIVLISPKAMSRAPEKATKIPRHGGDGSGLGTSGDLW